MTFLLSLFMLLTEKRCMELEQSRLKCSKKFTELAKLFFNQSFKNLWNTKNLITYNSMYAYSDIVSTDDIIKFLKN